MQILINLHILDDNRLGVDILFVISSCVPFISRKLGTC